MLLLALLLIIPCLISAEATCPDGKTTCPEGQVCCTVNNKQSCCDEGQQPLRSALLAAPISNSSVQNGMFDDCNTFTNCNGTCCNSGYFGCCRAYRLANCCAGGGCCDFMSTCCSGGWCCKAGYGKCCSSYSSRWCCKRSQRCGMDNTCYAGAGALSPTTLVTLVAAWLVAYAVKKM